MKRAILIGLFVLGLIAAGSAQAELVVSNLDRSNGGYDRIGADPWVSSTIGFGVSGDTTIRAITVQMLEGSPGGNVRLGLFNSVPIVPTPAEAPFEQPSWTHTSATPLGGWWNKPVQFTDAVASGEGSFTWTHSGVDLTAGNDYWIVMEVLDESQYFWGYSTQAGGDQGSKGIWRGYNGWYSLDAGSDPDRIAGWNVYVGEGFQFRIDTEVVPGPASAALLLVGGLGLFIRRRKKAATK